LDATYLTLEKQILLRKEKINYICRTVLRTLKNTSRPDAQIKFCKTVAVSTGLYGSEAWVMSARDRSRLQAVEMHFLRSVAGLTWQDHLRN
jgi:hypothetical protein